MLRKINNGSCSYKNYGRKSNSFTDISMLLFFSISYVFFLLIRFYYNRFLLICGLSSLYWEGARRDLLINK